MTLASFFTAIGIDVPSDHALHEAEAPITENLFRLGAAILATGLDAGVECPTDQELLAAARLAERAAATATALRTACLAKAEAAGAARVNGLTMADVIAEERRVPKNEATSAIQLAARQAQFPAALAKAAAGKISQTNLATAVDTLAHLRPMYTDDEFAAVEDLILKEAEIPSAAAFKKKCRTTRALLDETYRMSQEALHAKRRKRNFDDRGLSFSLIDDGEYGAQVLGIIPPEYLRELLPALNKASESAARQQRRERHSRRPCGTRTHSERSCKRGSPAKHSRE
ncbi:hypothetical protein BSZ39_08830 [Bowdeniella nasicola]|uniref:DUF222 domain-containing protein n=1 Tax=Bowdeniella nasicola TaxID=208480 RepID=A0A1Q5Q193_9ACTO|nr:hypothetical protein [Bowdeniella nasicola]OKL53567.1 hypothetical protein BSZ39_08830 [Bowdeniella nasicola]